MHDTGTTKTIKDFLAFIQTAHGPIQATYEGQPFPLIEARDGSVGGEDPQQILYLRVQRDGGQPASLSFSGSAQVELRRIDRGLRIYAEPSQETFPDCTPWRYRIMTSAALFTGRGNNPNRTWHYAAIVEDHESHKNTAMKLATTPPPREEAGSDDVGHRNMRIRLALRWLFEARYADLEPSLTTRILNEVSLEGYNGKPLERVKLGCIDGTNWTIEVTSKDPLTLTPA